MQPHHDEWCCDDSLEDKTPFGTIIARLAAIALGVFLCMLYYKYFAAEVASWFSVLQRHGISTGLIFVIGLTTVVVGLILTGAYWLSKKPPIALLSGAWLMIAFMPIAGAIAQEAAR
ncbi:MAG: hypothetical protein ACSLEY_02910 [Candidatus Saccharimonadales bacterium]